VVELSKSKKSAANWKGKSWADGLRKVPSSFLGILYYIISFIFNINILKLSKILKKY
jgi:hypothetical protein